jgi:hypothetical protein
MRKVIIHFDSDKSTSEINQTLNEFAEFLNTLTIPDKIAWEIKQKKR